MFEPGDLVKIKDDYDKERINAHLVSEHGYLWLVMHTKDSFIYCKSLATGDDLDGRGWLWFDQELEKADV